jgi:hypothetical protein
MLEREYTATHGGGRQSSKLYVLSRRSRVQEALPYTKSQKEG